MKGKGIISDIIASIDSLIDVVKTPIDEGVKAERMKGVLEGRHLAFTIAHSHINQLKDLEMKDNIFDSEEHKLRLEKLIDASDKLIPEISKVLRAKIELTEMIDDDDGFSDEVSKDEKFKSIVKSKEVALDFLREINNTQESLKYTLANNKVGEVVKKNFATDRVKRNL